MCRVEKTIPTAKGFLLPHSDGVKYAIKIIKCDGLRK